MIPALMILAVALFWTGVYLICRQIEQTSAWEWFHDGLSSAFARGWSWGLRIALWILPGALVGLTLGMLGIPWAIARIMIGAWVILTVVYDFRSESRTDSREG